MNGDNFSFDAFGEVNSVIPIVTSKNQGRIQIYFSACTLLMQKQLSLCNSVRYININGGFAKSTYCEQETDICQTSFPESDMQGKSLVRLQNVKRETFHVRFK